MNRVLSRGGLRRIFAVCALALFATAALWAQTVQFVFTSDEHYGITRKTFRSGQNVDAAVVNAALVSAMNGISDLTFAEDGGVSEGQKVGPIDFIAIGGDIGNRQEGTQEKAIQCSAVSWNQFKKDYIDGISLKNDKGATSPIYIIPGNHDVTDAIGFYKSMYPATDATVMANIYNMMMSPSIPLTKDTYNLSTDRVHFSKDIGGIHFVFITMWPDAEERAWIENDLSSVRETTPVILFAHDEPNVEAKHFINPNGPHDINAKDKFENILSEQFSGKNIDDSTTNEQRALENFLAKHKNISVYFHGNDHWKHYSEWTGIDNTIVLHVFGVDSPMKGTVSANDETKLSFYLVTIDSTRRLMTVRNCLWNADPSNPSQGVTWDDAITVALEPRPVY